MGEILLYYYFVSKLTENLGGFMVASVTYLMFFIIHSEHTSTCDQFISHSIVDIEDNGHPCVKYTVVLNILYCTIITIFFFSHNSQKQVKVAPMEPLALGYEPLPPASPLPNARTYLILNAFYCLLLNMKRTAIILT